MIVDGQAHGGLAQGIGQALLESCVYDAQSGQLLTGSYMDYTMPRAADLPMFKVGNHVTPCTHNPLGVKGCGEVGAIGAPPAVINAVLDALAPLGVKHIDMPATPKRSGARSGRRRPRRRCRMKASNSTARRSWPTRRAARRRAGGQGCSPAGRACSP